ncbi:Phosphoglycolate phosphatase [Streptomyces tanashiensis]
MGPMTTTPANAPTVGFDLDLTLLDTRPGIRAAFVAFSAETGVPIDADLVVSRLGPPLEQEIAHWFPAEHVTEMTARYRALYPTYAIEPTVPMPGARDAIEAVREAGGSTIVVTAKNGPHAELHLSRLGIEPDAVAGGLWAEGKAEALRAHGAGVYVGTLRRRPGRRRGQAPSRWPSRPAPAPPRSCGRPARTWSWRT